MPEPAGFSVARKKPEKRSLRAAHRIQGSLPPASGRRYGLRIDLQQRVDFAQDIGVDPPIIIDVEVSGRRIGREIVVDELAAEAGLRNERQSPAAALIVVDRPRHIGGDWLLRKGSNVTRRSTGT